MSRTVPLLDWRNKGVRPLEQEMSISGTEEDVLLLVPQLFSIITYLHKECVECDQLTTRKQQRPS